MVLGRLVTDGLADRLAEAGGLRPVVGKALSK